MRPPGILLGGILLLGLHISPSTAGVMTIPSYSLNYCPGVITSAIYEEQFCLLKARVPHCCYHYQLRMTIPMFNTFCDEQFPKTTRFLEICYGKIKIRHTTTTTPKPIYNYNLNNCIRFVPFRMPSRYIKEALKKHPYCCFHPTVRENPRAEKFCQFVGDFRRKIQASTPCNPSNHEFLKLGTNVPGRKRRADGDEDGPPVVDAAKLYEWAKNSPEEIEVTCCGENPTVVRKCGNGTSCDVCGDGVSALDLIGEDEEKAENEVEAACNPEITDEEVGGRRKKSWAAANMASWKLNWCPRRVTEGNWDIDTDGVKKFKICCFHPSCQKLGKWGAKEKCMKISRIFG